MNTSTGIAKHQRFSGRHISISLASLRVKSVLLQGGTQGRPQSDMQARRAAAGCPIPPGHLISQDEITDFWLADPPESLQQLTSNLVSAQPPEKEIKSIDYWITKRSCVRYGENHTT